MTKQRKIDPACAARAAEVAHWRPIEELVASPSLDREEKRQILLDRLLDERALLVAGDEGMTGDRTPRIDLVLRALHAIEG